MKTSYSIGISLERAIRKAAAQRAKDHHFSRKSPLTQEVLIRLLIGAEGGSLDKILHTANIPVSASALTQRRAQIDPAVFRTVFTTFNSTCEDDEFFRGYRLLAVDGVYAYKVNFKMAVMLCREFIRTPKADGEKLLNDIARYTAPIRPGRQDQRDLKVKSFPGFVYRVAA